MLPQVNKTKQKSALYVNTATGDQTLKNQNKAVEFPSAGFPLRKLKTKQSQIKREYGDL